MKRMLIIGNEFDGIKSVSFSEAESVNITDYQIVLIDLTNYQNIDRNLCGYIRSSLHLLYANSHPIIFILPRHRFRDYSRDSLDTRLFTHVRLNVESDLGSTVFFENEPLMNIYKSFVTKHEVVFGKDLLFDLGNDSTTLMWNNIKKCCSALKKSLYLLHPPDKNFHRKAIASIVEYFSPDMEEEKEDKPTWVEQYELSDLGLQKIENKINKIDQEIKKLMDIKNEHVNERENITKWSDLITKQGKTLEIRLKESFELLGIDKIEHEPSGSHGPDLFIQHNGKEFIIEIEGSRGPIRIDKARELLHWIAEAQPNQKGLLIGNPFRELAPNERPPKNNKLFVKEAVDLAESRGFVLITTRDIFNLVCKKINGEDVNLDDLSTKLYDSKGEICLS